MLAQGKSGGAHGMGQRQVQKSDVSSAGGNQVPAAPRGMLRCPGISEHQAQQTPGGESRLSPTQSLHPAPPMPGAAGPHRLPSPTSHVPRPGKTQEVQMPD